jgi:Cu2+-exporting ATPase
MRRIMNVAAIGLMGCFLVGPASADGQTDLVRTVFTVQGMHCGGCSSTITATLEKVHGVNEALADHEKGTAEAIYRPRKVDAEKLKAEIEKLGYTVTGMETEAVES